MIRYDLSLFMKLFMMRFALLGVLILLPCVSCSSEESTSPESPQAAAADPAAFLSAFQVADPRAQAQLAAGFYAVEQGSWRWTDRTFSVLLRSSTTVGDGRLEFRFTIVPQSIKRLGALTLSAAANGTSLGAAVYDQAGDFVYAKTVPADAVGDATVRVDFTLDKALPPNGGEQRTLGVIAVSAALRTGSQ